MAIFDDQEDRARASRVWNALGSLALGYDNGGEQVFTISSQAGQFTIDTPTGSTVQGQRAKPAIVTVAGYSLGFAELALLGGVAWLILKR